MSLVAELWRISRASFYKFGRRYQLLMAIRVLGLVFAVLAATGPANAGLKFCNKSNLPIDFAVGTYDAKSRYTDGWWTTWPGECATVVSGKLTNKTYYFFGKSHGFFEWKGDEKFCLVNEIMNGLDLSSCTETQGFGTIDIGDSVLDEYTQSFTCDDCKVPKFKYDQSASRITAYHVLSKDIFGSTLNIPIDGTFDFKIDNVKNEITARAQFDFDMRQVQSKFAAFAGRFNQANDCGDNFSISNISLVPNGTIAEMRANARYAKWVCTYADLPQITCTDTWITLPGVKTQGVPTCNTTCTDTWIHGPFGMKTKGIPACNLTCEPTWIEAPGLKTKGPPQCTNEGMKTVRTSENKLLEQSGSLVISMSPSISNSKDILITPSVTNGHLDGFGQTFADILKINVKGMAQSLLDTAIDSTQLSFAVPPEIRDFTILSDVHFYAGSNGELRMSASGQFKITGPQALDVCHRFWSAGNCAAVQ